MQRAALMAKLSPDVKMQVARREITLPQALAGAGLEIPEWLRTGASAPPDAPVAAGDVERSSTGTDPGTGRGHVLYLRYDGHYGLLVEAAMPG